jgi:rhamnose transport system permease protein
LILKHGREWAAAAALVALLLVLGAAAPDFYRAANLRDLIISNVPVLVAAVGMTLVIIARQIDISIGAQFAVLSVLSGLLAKTGLPIPLVALAVAVAGGVLGAINGALTAGLKLPAIVVTLAAAVALRDALRWGTEGAWVQGLPDSFQWFGLGQAAGQAVLIMVSLAVFAFFAWAMKNLAAGRAIYAVGSEPEAARLAGIRPSLVIGGVFILMGLLTGLSALLNAVRFIEVQGNAGVGLEMKVIAAAVVGGASIQGGRGTLIGTLVGVALLGVIGPALTFLGINPYWEKAVQGGIILAAVVSDYAFKRAGSRAIAQA